MATQKKQIAHLEKTVQEQKTEMQHMSKDYLEKLDFEQKKASLTLNSVLENRNRPFKELSKLDQTTLAIAEVSQSLQNAEAKLGNDKMYYLLFS